MSLTSAPVFPCSCAEGWKPEGWAYCAECYEGKIERQTATLKALRDDPAVPEWIRTLARGTLSSSHSANADVGEGQ